MPTYTYTDELKHVTTFTEPMLFQGERHCTICGAVMWRKPQPFAIHWAGMKPSAGEYSYAIRNHLSTLDEQRDKFTERHEQHERN